MKHSYDPTLKGVMGWASAELWHIGEITGMRDPDLQYAYAQSVANSMAHLHDAMKELLADKRYKTAHADLRKTFNVVVRALQGLMKRYKISVAEIRKFNVRHVLGDLSYLSV